MNIINKYVDRFKEMLTSKANKLVESMDLTGESGGLFSVTDFKESSLTKFRNKLEAKHGVATTNQFMISFELPSWMKDSKWLSYLGVTQFNEELGLLCYKVSPPTKTIQSTAVKYTNNLERKIPMGYKWDEVTFSFIERKDYFVYNTFNEWMDGINNPITNTGRFYNDCVADVKINFLDKNNNILAYYVLLEAKPTSISIGDLDWSQNNQFVSIDVTFDYLYSINKDYDLTQLVRAIQDFGNSDVSNTLDSLNISWKDIGSKIKNIF